MKIMIIGSSGSGKSTFARELGKITTFRVIKRSIKSRVFGKNRPDIAEEFKEKWDKEYLEFLKFVWTFPEKEFPQIEQKIKEFNVESKVIVLNNRKDKEKYLANYGRKAKN